MNEQQHEQPDGGPEASPANADKLRWSAAGDEAFDAEDYQRALRCYHEASMLDNSDSKVWSSLGLCYSNLGLNREAWRSFKLALQVAGEGEIMPLWYAGEFLSQMADYPLSAVLLSRYVQLETEEEYRNEAAQLLKEAKAHIGGGDDLAALESELAAGLIESQGQGTAGSDAEDFQIDTSGSASKAARGLLATLRGRSRGPSAAALRAGPAERLTGASTVSESQVDGADADEDVEGPASADAEEELIWDDEERGGFIADLGLQLSGFAGKCSHCSTMIPTDAPYCYVCRRPHLYPPE